jgi:hypothetical protein
MDTLSKQVVDMVDENLLMFRTTTEALEWKKQMEEHQAT